MKRKDFSNLKIETQKTKESTFEHEGFIAGTTPFLRGIHPTMYLQNPLKTSILINLSSPEQCNILIKEKITKGYENFTIHFNLSTSNLHIKNKTSSVKILTTKDIVTLFKEIDLPNLKITICANDNHIKQIIKLVSLGIKELHTTIDDLNLSIQLNNNLSTEIFEDIILYSYENIPKLKRFEIYSDSKNQLPEIELANLLSTSYLFFQKWVSKNKSIDHVAPKISFNLKIENNSFIEISKARAARMLWAKMIHLFNPKNQQSYALQLKATVKNSLSVFPAIFGGYQEVTSFENSQLVALEETSITKTVDPWAGSNFIEKKTTDITNKAWTLFSSNTIQ